MDTRRSRGRIGVAGVLFALAQHDIKKLLAYHSVENIGIITLGLGIGLLGMSYRAPVVAALGFAGAFLHVLNHALFKGLLFLGAGAAAHAAGTREIDRLGGLLRRMPFTGVAFLVGAAAICGLPPLNGFVSELLVFPAAFHAVSSGHACRRGGGGAGDRGPRPHRRARRGMLHQGVRHLVPRRARTGRPRAPTSSALPRRPDARPRGGMRGGRPPRAPGRFSGGPLVAQMSAVPAETAAALLDARAARSRQGADGGGTLPRLVGLLVLLRCAASGNGRWRRQERGTAGT